MNDEVKAEEALAGTVPEEEELAEGGEAKLEGEEDARPGKEEVAEVEAAATDDEREAIRARRRQERHDRKEAQREREDSLRRELASRDQLINDLSGRLTNMERKGQTIDIGQLDSAIKQSADAYNYYKEQHALAVTQQNGAVAADSMEKLIVAQRRYEDLNRHKNAVAQQATRPAPLDPRVVNHAKGWLERNKWYDPNGGNEDSQMASDIDTRLSAAGWNPATPQYWEELDTRLKKYLPHRYKQAHNTNARSTVAGSGRSSAPAAGSGAYSLSAARVQAIKDAGKWDDSAEREKMIKTYQAYDKQRTAAGN